MSAGDFAIEVEIATEQGGTVTPVRFSIRGRQVDVAEVVDRWLGEDRRYYKVRGDDGDLYILRHEPLHERWELTLFASGSSPLAGIPLGRGAGGTGTPTV